MLRNRRTTATQRLRGNRFAETPSVGVPRSTFDLSYTHKTTFQSARLIPVYVQEVLPGDTFNVRAQLFGRMATPIYPVMDNSYLDIFWFFVPYRLVWDNWQKFMGEKDDPTDTTEYTLPIMDAPANGHQEETLADYLGLPTEQENFSHSCLPFRAYTLIYDEWFRDQNLQEKTNSGAGTPTDDGPDFPVEHPLQVRNKRHDYLSSALPWPQKGDGVDIPLATGGVVPDPDQLYPTFQDAAEGQAATLRPKTTIAGAGGQADVELDMAAGTQWEAGNDLYWDDPGLTVSLNSTSINELRSAFALQQFLERDARGGTRYTELIRSHFGVVSPDARQQRPEYLGGGSSRMTVNPIANTNQASNDLGDLAGYVTISQSNNGFVKSFTEHGIILGIVNARAQITYQNTLDRWWSRQTRYDFFWPDLAHTGEQAILTKETGATGTAAADAATFGYIPRYEEYRFAPNKITGYMRSNSNAPLDAWHLALAPAAAVLNNIWIKDAPPFDRVIATATNSEFILDCAFEVRATRPMPTWGIPGLRRL